RSLSRRDEEWALVAWDVQTGKQRVTGLGPIRGPSWPPELAPDGSLVARLDGPRVHVCDSSTAKDLVTLLAPGEGVVNVAFRPDNRVLAGVCLGREGDVGQRHARTLVLWELATGKELHRMDLGRLAPDSSYGAPLAFSPDGRFLAGGNDGAVH